MSNVVSLKRRAQVERLPVRGIESLAEPESERAKRERGDRAAREMGETMAQALLIAGPEGARRLGRQVIEVLRDRLGI